MLSFIVYVRLRSKSSLAAVFFACAPNQKLSESCINNERVSRNCTKTHASNPQELVFFLKKKSPVYEGERQYHELNVGAPASALGFYNKAELEGRAPGSQREVHLLYGTDH